MLASEIQERKNKRALITLIVLIVLTIASAFLIKTSEKTSFDKTVFKNIDFEAVNKIRIENNEDTIELSFTGARWMVNGEFSADRNLITLFFATLKQAEPKREISDALADSISKEFDLNRSDVTLLADGKPIHRFTAYGNDAKTQSFFKDSETGKFYLMAIPGYRVYVSGIFELKTAGWRDKLLFGSFNWRNFKSLEAQFPDKPAENFKILGEGVEVYGVQGINTDTAKLKTFLYDVSIISVVDYPESTSLRDSLTRVKPFLNLLINDITGKQHSLKVFRENKSGVLGLWMDNQPVLFDPQGVRNIIRPKSFFIQK